MNHTNTQILDMVNDALSNNVKKKEKQSGEERKKERKKPTTLRNDQSPRTIGFTTLSCYCVALIDRLESFGDLMAI